MSDDHSRIIRLEENTHNIYETLKEMKKSAKERGEKLDDLIMQIAVAVATVEKIKELEARLQAVESWRWYTLGGVAVIVFLVDVLLKKL
jgi:hypothetical protein